MNLIPSTPGHTPNYWCTWSTQNYGREEERDYHDYLGDAGAKLARGAMNEKSLRRWARQFPEIRSDLFLLLDDGWDVPYGIHPDKNLSQFGSLAPDPERFPSFVGTPAQRLHGLNGFVKEAGWRGLGLWVPAQAAGRLEMGPGMRDYWAERLAWCREAGIEYWKVDWGSYANDPAYRRFLTDLAAQLYPQLIVEHAYCMGPLNGQGLPDEENPSDRFAQMGQTAEKSLEVHAFSQVLRTYDVFHQNGVASTLDRVAYLLQGEGGLLNCEDNVQIAASLGCTAGIMRSAYWRDIKGMDYDSTQLRHQLDVVTAGVLWQRIAPAFAGGETHYSAKTLTDRWLFQAGDCWMSQVFGHEIHQTAPAVIARGMPLPRVEAPEELPFVTCSQNPTGAVTVAAHRRVFPVRQERLPLCSVLLEPGHPAPFLGVFGSFREICLRLPERPGKALQVWGQSLLSKQAVEVTHRATLGEDGILHIPGALIEELYRPTPSDLSDPAVLFALREQ